MLLSLLCHSFDGGAGIEVVASLKSDPSITDTLTIPLTTDLAQLPRAVAERAAERNAIAAH